MNLKEVLKYIEGQPYNLKKLSDESGVKYHTLRNLLNGTCTNPSYETFERIENYVNSKQVKK